MTQTQDEVFTERGFRDLNVEAIRRLIAWAELSQELEMARDVLVPREEEIEALLERLRSEFPGWGRWYQADWATFSAGEEETAALAEWLRDELEVPDSLEVEEELVGQFAPQVHPCGSAFCMAGETVLRAGYRLDFDMRVSAQDEWTGSTASLCVAQRDSGRRTKSGRPIMEDAGELEHISVAARRILGLDDYESERFFSGTNGVHALKAMANGFAVDRGGEPLYPDHETW